MINLGEDLYNNYPQFCTINGKCYNIKSVSKTFRSIDEAFNFYNVIINNNLEKHLTIIDDIKWGIKNKYYFPTLDKFIIEKKFDFLHNYRHKLENYNTFGKELYEIYPINLEIKGKVFNARRISNNFKSLEEAFQVYTHLINNNNFIHKEIIELIKWGKCNNYMFPNLGNFIVDKAWESIRNFKENENK